MKKINYLFYLWIAAIPGFAQNIGINNTGTTPNNSTILDLNTGNNYTSPNGKGLLLPNIALTSTSDAVTIASPATSLLIYNTATVSNVTPGYYYNSGTPAVPVWSRFTGGMQTYGVYSTRTNINSAVGTYKAITGLSQTITLTNATNIVIILANGAVETQSTSGSGGSATRMGIHQNGVLITGGTQTVDVANTSGVTQVVAPFSISYFTTLTPGVYTFDVRAMNYTGGFSNFYAGGSQTSSTNEGNLTIMVFPQ